MSKTTWIHIPGNVPSLKNSKQIIQLPQKGARSCPVCKKRPGRPMLTASKTHKAYAKATAPYWIQGKPIFHSLVLDHWKPYYVLLYFIRDSRRKWDFTNATDTVQDLMVEHGWIDDDNADEIIPMYAGHRVEKEKAGIYISVLTPDMPYMERVFGFKDAVVPQETAQELDLC